MIKIKYKFTDSHRKKLSQAHIKNPTNYWTGKRRSVEDRKKMSDGHKGLFLGDENPSKRLDVREKIRMALTGRKISEEHRRNIGISHMGLKHTKEHNKKIGDSLRGKKSYLWQGGKSFEEYGMGWTNDLKNSIRKRDHYACQECGILQDKLSSWNKKLDVHHKDYDKKNLCPDNLITLCRKCHVRTNINREYWKKYFGVVG